MKIFRAITIGGIIWTLGVSIFSLSFLIPLMENVEQQANVVLLIAVIPLLWYGAGQYHKKDNRTHGIWVGLTFFGVAAILDALITVPLLVIPNGGSHYAFFTDPGFWLIGSLFTTIPIMYGYFRGVGNKKIS